MSNLYREPSIDASYQVSVHLAKQFQRRRFLEIDQLETRIPVVAIFVNGWGRNEQSQQKTFHRCFLLSLASLAKRFSREEYKKISHRCILPSFGSFGKAVSEKIS